MIDGNDQAAAFQAALDCGLPALIGGACQSVEDGIQNASPATLALRCSLLAYLRVALWTAELVLEAEKKGGPAPANISPGHRSPRCSGGSSRWSSRSCRAASAASTRAFRPAATTPDPSPRRPRCTTRFPR